MELKTRDNRGDSLSKVEKLRTVSYASWSLDIVGVPRAKDQWHCVEQALEAMFAMLRMLSEKDDFDLKTQFDRALGTILCNGDHTYKEMIRDCTRPKEA
jgi:hypothetical protein